MGANFSGGNTTIRGASYSRAFTPASGAVDLTDIAPMRKACSGMVVIPTGAGTLVYKDCTGTSVSLAGMIAGTPVNLPVAAISLEASSIAVNVLVYWNP